ncbi:hypothetical protein MRBLMR1_005863 [Neorhizobium sp. LMR1-1-1.1]
MIQLEIGVVAESKKDALQRGAIVTITQIANLAGEKVRSPQPRTKVIDISGDLPSYSVFSFEDPGVYEIAVRSPYGTDWKEIALQEAMKVTMRIRHRRRELDYASIVELPRLSNSWLETPKLPNGNDAPEVGRNEIASATDLISYGRVFNYFNQLAIRAIDAPTFSNFSHTNLLRPLDRAAASPSVEYGFTVPRFSDSARIDAPTVGELNNLYFSLRGQQNDGIVPTRWQNSFGRNGRDLVSIPWLWFPLVDDSDRSVEFTLRQSRSHVGPTTVLDVQDTKWGALLEFVTQGRMFEASRVVDSLMQDDAIGPAKSLPEYALQGKLQDPLVAVLGGIILVSNVVELRDERWDAWLENLANWFPNLPDAAAIYGYRCLQRGQGDPASHWLRRSIDQGLPYFSATFRLLTLSLSQLGDRETLDLISPAAAAVDVTQPFTVIHVPWG